MKNSILIIAITVIAMSSCKDKNKEQPTPKPTLSSKQTMLIGKDWKIKTAFVDGTDITSFLDSCMKDNTFYHFTDAGNGYFDEGATKCDQADPQRENFTWKLEQNETRMITTSAEGKDTFDLLNLTVSELKIGFDKDILTLKN